MSPPSTLLRTHTCIHHHRPLVITSILHPYLPPPLTRIFPRLSPVSTPISHLYLPSSRTRVTPSLALVSTSVWHSYYPSTRCLPEPRSNDCQKREDMTGEWRWMRKGVDGKVGKKWTGVFFRHNNTSVRYQKSSSSQVSPILNLLYHKFFYFIML